MLINLNKFSVNNIIQICVIQLLLFQYVDTPLTDLKLVAI